MSELSEEFIEGLATEHFGAVGGLVVSSNDFFATERLDGASALATVRLLAAVRKLNPHLPSETSSEVVQSLTRPPEPTLIQNNRWFHQRLVNGVEVEYIDEHTGDTRGGWAKLIDFENPELNELIVARQLTIAGQNDKYIRPDLTVFLNGIPIALIELKDPTDEKAGLFTAYKQFERYKETAPDFFTTNLLLVVSDGLLTRVGSVSSDYSRFTPWRGDDAGEPTLQSLIHSLFKPPALLDYLQHCVVFEETERGDIVKKIGGWHQFRAVRKTREYLIEHLKEPYGNGDGRGGVVWHTQGSGKSLTMLMLAGALIRHAKLENPTIVVVSDRNDLDDQLFETFAMGKALLRQAPQQAESRSHLTEILSRASGGVIFTTIHKFADSHDPVSDRANIVVMADEAHRSQYGLEKEGSARKMREALPNATFIGFTGTPLELDDKNTVHVFGNYTDKYDVLQAVLDGATKPIYYESHIVPLSINENAIAESQEFVRKATIADGLGAELNEQVRIATEALVGANERLHKLAEFIVEHWGKRRDAIEGKAMIVTMSREIAANLYSEIAELRPEWHTSDDKTGQMKVIITGAQGDEGPVIEHTRMKSARKRLADRFKDPEDEFRIAIVCDMWLTGFDCPPVHTMYLDKPLAGHNLMQAIARVNRVYGEKPSGLVVDLLGLADRFGDALATYAQAGGRGEAVHDVRTEAIPRMWEAFEQLRNFFHEFDYSAALVAKPQDVLPLYVSAVDYVLSLDDGWKRFQELVKKLSGAFAIAVPLSETEAVINDLAFFQQVAAMIRKQFADSGMTRAKQHDIDFAVRQVVGGAVAAGEVIDLFSAAGLESTQLDILSDDFLQRVAAMDQKHLALETLRKLLNDQIRATERANIVQSRNFREALQNAMQAYTNKAITTAEMIACLIDLAHHIRELQQRGHELGLNQDEAAFYDALAENGSAKEVMKRETLRLMARELTETIRSMPKLDWTRRESVRADLRRQVRRLLAKYGYPPDLAEDATLLVLRQAELSTDNAE